MNSISWYALHPEAKHEHNRCYRQKHKIELSQKSKTYYGLHREDFKEKARLYYLHNTEQIKQRVKKWQQNNSDKTRLYKQPQNNISKKIWYELNKERLAEKHRAYYILNRDKILDKVLARAKNPLVKNRNSLLSLIRYHCDPTKKIKIRLLDSKRRGMCEGIQFDAWLSILKEYGNKCAYCGVKSDKLQIEHIIPIKAKGNNNTDNVVPACIECNRRKGDRPLLYALGKLHYSKVLNE